MFLATKASIAWSLRHPRNPLHPPKRMKRGMKRADPPSGVVGTPLSAQVTGENVLSQDVSPTNWEEHLSVDTPTSTTARSRAAETRDLDAGGGWLTFAGILLMIVGIMNFIGGIAAIDDANFFVGNAKFQFGDLNTWGWVILILGAVQVLTAIGLFARNGFARGIGVVFASLAAMASLLMLPAYPLWSLALFTMDILIIYGLVSYSSEDY